MGEGRTAAWPSRGRAVVLAEGRSLVAGSDVLGEDLLEEHIVPVGREAGQEAVRNLFGIDGLVEDQAEVRSRTCRCSSYSAMRLLLLLLLVKMKMEAGGDWLVLVLVLDRRCNPCCYQSTLLLRRKRRRRGRQCWG